MVTVKSLRDIRPRFTVADFSACLPFARLLLAITVVAALSALRATTGLAGQHDRPVPILMYHVIAAARPVDRKSTRLNSSHVRISYAVFCLKKKKKIHS